MIKAFKDPFGGIKGDQTFQSSSPYKIDKELLQGTEVNRINSCSTGLNHIDLEYCKQNNTLIEKNN